MEAATSPEADLVVTAGQQFDFEQVVVRAAAFQPVPQSRFLASRSRPVVHSRFIRFAVADEVVHQFSFGLLRPVLGQSPVDFTDFAVFDQFVHTRQRLAGLGEKHGSADRTVDAVHDAEEHVARFVVAHVDERFDFVFEGRIAGRVGLHQLSGTFVDYDQVVVFVQDGFGIEHGSG